MKNKFNLFGILFMSILVLVLSYNSFAQDGSLDLSFGNGGKVITPIGLGQDIGYSVAIQADGKIVMAGSSYIVNDDFALSRYNSNGSLDLSFGTSGIVTTSIGSAGDVAHSVAIQTDGKIVVAGYSYINNHRDFALTRYNTNGSLDTSFDTDGKVTTPIGSSTDEGYAVAIQADGKIVVAGTTFNGSIFDFALIRYNSNGSLDLSFDIDGIVTTHIGSGTSFGYAVAMQADGKIVVAGFSDNGF
jgi:uncharacterized delta-60 repeat protein